MDKKNIKFRKTGERKKAAKLKKGGRYDCNICGMTVRIYEPCECMDVIILSCCGKKMLFSL